MAGLRKARLIPGRGYARRKRGCKDSDESWEPWVDDCRRYKIIDAVAENGLDLPPMKQRTTAIAFVLSLLATAAFASGPEMGTWKLNEKKSRFTPGTPMNVKVVNEQNGDKIEVTVWTVAQDGKRWKNEWTGKFDGKDYPVTGDSNVDSRSVKKVGSRTYRLVVKKGGKVMATGKIVYAKDGKSRVVTVSGKSADGKRYRSSSVYDKE
jgi:hypothetical protein